MQFDKFRIYLPFLVVKYDVEEICMLFMKKYRKSYVTLVICKSASTLVIAIMAMTIKSAEHN